MDGLNPRIEQYIDVDTGMGRLRNNKGLYSRMLQMFLNSKEFANLEEAIASGDNEKGEAVAHTIKGMAGNLALTTLFEESDKLMLKYREGSVSDEDIQNYRTCLDNTLACVELLIQQLAG